MSVCTRLCACVRGSFQQNHFHSGSLSFYRQSNDFSAGFANALTVCVCV